MIPNNQFYMSVSLATSLTLYLWVLQSIGFLFSANSNTFCFRAFISFVTTSFQFGSSKASCMLYRTNKSYMLDGKALWLFEIFWCDIKFAIGYLVQFQIPFLMAMGTSRSFTIINVFWMVEKSRNGKKNYQDFQFHLLESQIGSMKD